MPHDGLISRSLRTQDARAQNPALSTPCPNANQRPFKAITPHPHGGQQDLTLPLADQLRTLAPRLVRIRAHYY
uniref:HDC18552 n=1 Tax=Drosophila melanogaster TaxID=7227 RepID=Q6IIE7_DROME|nr:TPA_inf: HDC18552 [Drosophila melanogaster]